MMSKKKLEEKCEEARVKLLLADEDVKILQRCARGVYEDVAYDIDPEGELGGSVDRDTVLEVVCDANRLENELRRSLKLGRLQPLPIQRVFDDYDILLDLIGPAFPYSRYEVG